MHAYIVPLPLKIHHKWVLSVHCHYVLCIPDLLLFSRQEEIGLMIWNRAHAELSYLQEIESWKDRVASAGTGILDVWNCI